MRKLLSTLLIISTCTMLWGQIDLSYQKPSKEILELADVDRAPSLRISRTGQDIVLLKRNQYKTIEELSATEMRLGGLRIDPKTNIGSRTTFYTNIELMTAGDKTAKQVTNLPKTPKLANFSWSPDEKHMAFTNTTQTGVELWVLNVKDAKATRLTEPTLNANMGRPFIWYKSSDKLIIKQIPTNRKELINKKDAIPTGPRISVNEGKEAQNRTYQDLLGDKVDEQNFEQLTRSALSTIDLLGNETPFMEARMYRNINFSPDGNFVLISYMDYPFSYLVPYYRFPTTHNVYKTDGSLLKTIEQTPLTEDIPKGMMSTTKGKRSITWRNDEPATIVFVQALDDGDSEIEVPFRDEIFTWKAPFEAAPRSLAKTINRYSQIVWGNENFALVYDYWWNTRNMKTYIIDPANRQKSPIKIQDRNYQDKYNDPGSPFTEENQYGESVLALNKNSYYLRGAGYSADGIFPFIDEYNYKTKKTKRLWQANAPDELERIIFATDIRKGQIITRIESANKYPNYVARNIRKKDEKNPITFFKNPFESLSNIHKEIITYKRYDGVDLSATLYLPENYDKTSGEKLPLIMWAYPYEFKDKNSAGQITNSPNEFTYPWYGSPIFWVNKGYAILDDASFPIIGEGDEEPNDSFIEQLIGNAKAAIDTVVELGYVDRNRVAVGGHSYGAFMTANLLTHCDLFAAGIARSGAYNRTLTPFGFQSEERNYWEAPIVYNTMSPFMTANKMKGNLLLIHGEDDNNSGTYPMQSERYFNALKGLGANVRLVMLPKESHGYQARESVMHVLWEQDQWLEKYVKNKN